MITYLGYLMQFLNTILNINIVNGITIGTMFFYNLMLITFWFVFTRRG